MGHTKMIPKLLIIFAFISSISSQYCLPPPTDRCTIDNCNTNNNGNCHFSGQETPYDVEHRPQIVYLTFDDGFTARAEELYYRELFDVTYMNPNGCPIRATHFITRTASDYSKINEYWHKGHEIAAHSITHRNNVTYWANMSPDEWAKEMVGIRKMIGQFANIDPCEVKGTRAPFLQGGGDDMFQMLSENNFKYDCSWPTRQFGYVDTETGLYPYTLDYPSKQDCPIKPCPECSWPGIWVQPMIDLEDEWYNSNPNCPTCGNVCSMLDGCVIIEDFTAEHVYNMLMKNFRRVYIGEEDDFGNFIVGNKAPWGLYMHAAWFFGNDWHYEGYKMFIQEITNSTAYPDVYIVPIEAGIRYMQAPMPIEVITNQGKKDTTPFGCESIEAQSGKYDGHPCGQGISCKFEVDIPSDHISEQRYMKICKYVSEGDSNTPQICPEEDQYPWLGNNCGGNTPCNDCSA